MIINAKSIPTSIMRLFAHTRWNLPENHHLLQNKDFGWMFRQLDRQSENDGDAREWTRILSEATFQDLWRSIKANMEGLQDYGWQWKPAIMIQTTDKSGERCIEDREFRLLCKKIHAVYQEEWPTRDAIESVYVQRVPTAFSRKLKLHSSILGSAGTQSNNASFITSCFDGIRAPGQVRTHTRTHTHTHTHRYHSSLISESPTRRFHRTGPESTPR